MFPKQLSCAFLNIPFWSRLWILFQLKDVAQTAIDATNSISGILISKMLGGERPKKFQTPFLGLEIAKTEPDKLPVSYGVNGGGVNVPSFMKSLVANVSQVSYNKTKYTIMVVYDFRIDSMEVCAWHVESIVVFGVEIDGIGG